MQSPVPWPIVGPGLLKWDGISTAKVLVVEDSPFQQRVIGDLLEEVEGWEVMFAAGGEEAIAIAEREGPNIIVTDLIMPDMDGLELLQLARARFPEIPVVLMTSYGSEDIAMQALRAGAANYIPKKYLCRDLADTVGQVLNMSDTTHRRRTFLKSLKVRESAFEFESDVRLVPPLVQLIVEEIADIGILDPVSQLRTGVALHEALANACYHGNLEISPEIRRNDEQAFQDLVEQRRATEPFASRRVWVRVRLDKKAAEFTIRDEGRGFDTATLDCPRGQEDLMQAGGRGMLLIRTFMDEVRFNSIGNQITMTKRLDPAGSR